MEKTERWEWMALVICLLGVVIALGLAWARDEQSGDCYFSSGREIEIGKWKSVGDDQMACVKR